MAIIITSDMSVLDPCRFMKVLAAMVNVKKIMMGVVMSLMMRK